MLSELSWLERAAVHRKVIGSIPIGSSVLMFSNLSAYSREVPRRMREALAGFTLKFVSKILKTTFSVKPDRTRTSERGLRGTFAI